MQAVEAKPYWESIHEENLAADVSWYQESPRTSLALIDKLAVPRSASILDVGCGQRGLAGALAARGYARVSALDISRAALARARDEAGPAARDVEWIESDVLSFRAKEPVDLWHDRALLHFFRDDPELRQYADSVQANLTPGGAVIVATFAPDGPEKCSGLPVQRHDATSIGRVLGPKFTPLTSLHEIHTTPWGKEQAFQWAVFTRRG